MSRILGAPRFHNGRLRLSLAVPLLLAACSVIAPAPSTSPSSSAPAESSSTGNADVTLTVSVPSDTPVGGQVRLILLDEVTGLPFHSQDVPMQQLPDGRWQAVVTGPDMSVLHYRYALRGPINADETTARGEAIRDRKLWLPSSTAVDDQIAAWAGGEYPGLTGRIVGTVVDSDSGQPLHEILVSASGISAFSDGQGGFRLEGLPPGGHTLTALSPDGSTIPFQQGAVVAADSATPATIALRPARPVQVTFEVEIPPETASGMSLRMAGNLVPLGGRFADLPGGAGGAVERMPTLVQVDPNHFILITELFSGTDLRYKYTLGDGLRNAERDAEGLLRTRQLIVPDDDAVIQDVVEAWTSPGSGAVTFQVRVPSGAPEDTTVGVQFAPSDGSQPLPMGLSGEDTWTYTFYDPLGSQATLPYRYCRMADCWHGYAGGSGEALADPRRLASSAAPITVDDVVAAWLWSDAAASPGAVEAPEIEPRPAFEAGIELQPDPDPNAVGFTQAALREIAAGGANAVTLTPGWSLGQPNRSPLMAFDPGKAPFASEIISEMSEARQLGLRTSLRPTLTAPDGDLSRWWAAAARDAAWWDAWFESYRTFVLSYARVAAEGGADKIILGGPEAAPAFPRGTLQDGSSASTPLDSEWRWREIIAAARSVFAGKIALELELSRALQPPPAFVDDVDQVHIYWHPPLNSEEGGSVDAMRMEAGRWMDEAVLSEPRLLNKPTLLSIEYPSVIGGESGCVPTAGGACLLASQVAMGATLDPSPALDLETQARVYNAILGEAYDRSRILGIYARGYNSALGMQDLSASVRGKPAQDVLWYWYTHLTGQAAP